jgi:dihydroneopterin aldolase
MADTLRIIVKELEVWGRIGVTDAERREPQRMTVSLEVTPRRGFEGSGDDIGRAVDYFVLTERVKGWVAGRPRNLIETLAAELADAIRAEFPVASVEVEVRKYILPDTRYVAVRVGRGV